MCEARRGQKKAERSAQQNLWVLKREQPIPKVVESGFLLAKHGQGRKLDLNPVRNLPPGYRQGRELCRVYHEGLEKLVHRILDRRCSTIEAWRKV